jgi:hypothetical protein
MTHFTTNKEMPSVAKPAWSDSHVAVALDAHNYLLSDGRVARQALGCLITPEVGDRVLAASGKDGTPFIVHILQRAELGVARLSVPGARELALCQPRIAVSASEQINLHALRNIEVTAATGVLGLNANNLFITVNETLVQNVRNFIGKSSQYLLEARQLLRLHGQQTLVTAEQDVKIDGERISVG